MSLSLSVSLIYVHVYESVMWIRVTVSAGKALYFALADDSFLLSILYNLCFLKELHDFYMSLCVMESWSCLVPPLSCGLVS